MEQAGIHPVRGGGETDDLEGGIDALQVLQKAPVHGVALPGNEMGLVHQHQIAALDVVSPFVDRLDAAEEHLGFGVPAVQSGAEDSSRGLGPQADQLGEVLPDQLTDVGQDNDAGVRKALDGPPDEIAHHQRLAPGSGDHHQAVAAVLLEIGVDGIVGLLLVGAHGVRHGCLLRLRRAGRPVAPEVAVRKAVQHPLLAGVGVDLFAGDQVGNEQVVAATLALIGDGDDLIPPGAMPGSIGNRRDMQAGAAVDLRHLPLMAQAVMGAKPALVPGGILADARRGMGGFDDPARLGQQPFRLRRFGPDPFGMEFIGILADRQIQGPGHAGQGHVDLHLGEMLRLGQPDALGLQFVEGFGVVGLELADVPSLRSLRNAQRHPIQAAAEVAAMGLHPPLASAVRIDVQDSDADAAQVGHQTLLFALAGLEQPQHPPGERRPGGPVEVQPQGALALLADERSTQVGAEPILGVRLVGGHDGLYRGRLRWRQLGHHRAPWVSRRRCA
ncbi:hypothetical protein MAIT1_04551 [Magnetofaba australis IT-1]|uniref:Uncharacterized protein n=1 Tax=Magnetofaba australis IT-1 TaxID=1434232 RepID=A0A1Y2K9P7_9PROT|nr:hypothetical protein MAIT1_04551 [Magnetofaba australis IT-1]